MARRGSWLVASGLLLELLGARADLPVHCLRSQIVGEWDFQLSGLSEHRSSCGHQRPDDQEVQPVKLDSIAETRRLTLEQPNVVHTKDGGAGTFTMIYDEGFEVKIEDLTLFAFSGFELVGPQKKNVSHCGETMVGWYRDAAGTKWGCYVARKVEQPLSFMAVDEPQGFKPTANYEKPLGLEWHQDHVAKINRKHKKWSARVYLQFVGMSMRQLNDFSGIRRTVPRQAQDHLSHAKGPGASFVQIRAQDCPDMPRTKPGAILPHLLLRRPRPCQLRDTALFTQPADEHNKAVAKSMPKSKEWKEYLPPVMDQADCGSCYMVSTIRMLTVRHRIATNNSQAEPFSIAFPLHCSEYNQGCKGGYGFLASKWSEDVGLLPESCFPYKTDAKCGVQCDVTKLQKRWRATNHHYIGGYYGASGAGDMMTEMYKNGPFVISFEPSDEFMFYSGGVFESVQGPMSPLVAHDKEWQQVDHAVLLVGWGEEFASPYWSVQNSWGSTWGENGFFRILRGTNEAGVESIALAADVVEETRAGIMLDFLGLGKGHLMT